MRVPSAVLAVGSELLSGQIVNRNAAWISGRLFEHGIDPRQHLTVDDVEGEIVKAIEALTAEADLVFITGGLGPTSDDLTRNAVAKWCGEELVFHPESWEHVQRLFSRLTSKVPESNRQQCFFPTSARILENRAGTANAFTITAHGKELWVLPGPPKEVETIWIDHVEPTLRGRVPLAGRMRLRMWRTIGRGESALAEMIEPLAIGQGVELAYRAHAPFVELKVRFPEARAAELTELCDRIETTLRPWLYETDAQDVPADLVAKLLQFESVDIYDGATQGNLLELLGPHLRDLGANPLMISLATSWESHDEPTEIAKSALEADAGSDVMLVIAGFDENGKWSAGIRVNGETQVIERASLYKGEAHRARNLKAVASLAVKAWLDLLGRGAMH